MENKYYTPTIEELLHYIINEKYIITSDSNETDIKVIIFHEDINFITSLHNFIESGQKEIINKNKIKYFLDPSLYKIKYLDKKDIESLGFEQHKTLAYQYYKDNFMLVSLKQDCQYSIEDLTNSQYIFYGTIKNKSELKVLLKQLGV